MAFRCVLFSTLVLAAGCLGAPAYANPVYVASTGSDANLCTRTSPCQSLGTAFTHASPNDTIVCLDTVVSVPSVFVINKSISIDCSAARHVLRDIVGTAIFINIGVSPQDPLRTVRLRGISILGTNGVSRGIDIASAAAVYLEGVVVSDVSQQGVIDRRTDGSTKLFITDSIVRNNGGAGIVAAAGAPSVVVLNNVSSENNAYGIAVAAGNNVVINRSVFSGNTAAGIEADGGAQVVVDNSTISHNNIGVQGAQSVRLSNNNIAFNATAVSGSSGTFGNNRFSGNATIGTPPVALGGASSDLGQQ
jgi:hypothetical protein